MDGSPLAAVPRPHQGPPLPPLRVLCVLLAPEPVPGPRYRVLQYLPTLAAHGLECDVLPMLTVGTAVRSVAGAAAAPAARIWHWVRIVVETQWASFRMVRVLGHYDRVLVYRVALPGWASWWLGRRRADVIYDFDDALDAAEGTSLIERVRRRWLARALQRAVAHSAVVTTSNARNAAVIAELGGHAVVVPTSVDDARFPPRRDSRGPIVLGWMGTPSTSRYLPAIETALVQVLAARPGTVVRLVGAGYSPFTRLTADVVPWSESSEVEALMRVDIGLMPMPDTAWTRGKAALKALQYGAARMPTVASWTPTNEDILGAGGGTVLCRTEEEWVAALLALIDDPARRRAMGEAAHMHVHRHFSVAVNGPRLAAVVREPLGART